MRRATFTGMSGRTALLAGATGLVGGHCLRLLLDDTGFERVLAVVRRPLGITNPKLDEQLVDFERLRGTGLSGTHVFCALGSTIRKAGSRDAFRQVDHDYVVSLAHAGLEAGARVFLLVSSVGANARSGNFYLRTKGETEAAVAALPFEAVHLFRPGLLLGHRSESRPGERVAQAAAPTLRWALRGTLERYRPIAAEEVARAMVTASHLDMRGVQVYEYAALQKLCAKTPA